MSVSISTVVAIVGVGRSISRPFAVVVTVSAVAVVGISRRLGGRGSFSRPLAVDNSMRDIRVASVAVVGAEAVVTVVGISLGSRGSLSLSRPLAVVVAIAITTIEATITISVTEAIVAVVGVSLSFGLRSGHGH